MLYSMPTKFALHTSLLLAATIGVYVWLSIPSLEPYTLQLVAVLVLIYMGIHWSSNHAKSSLTRSTISLDITVLTTMILLLVEQTGALASPFFFLCYFLLFAVAMLYEIEATLVLTGVLVAFFLFAPSTNLSDIAHLSQVLALIMITPLAIFTAHEYESVLEVKTLNQQLSKHLGSEESDTLLFLSLNLKRTLLSALDTLSGAIPSATTPLRAKLTVLYEDLKALYRSSQDLESAIDHETEE